MSYQPDPDRYKKMIYRRCGRSGLKLPAISLGLWHNFGDATLLAPSPREPSAPALLTAAASSGVETPAIGAWISGISIARYWLSRSDMGFSSVEGAAVVGTNDTTLQDVTFFAML